MADSVLKLCTAGYNIDWLIYHLMIFSYRGHPLPYNTLFGSSKQSIPDSFTILHNIAIMFS